MKKMRNRLLSLFIAFALLAGMFPVGALAAEDLTALPVELEVQRSRDGRGGYDAMLENREDAEGGTSLLNEAQAFAAPNPLVYDGGDLYSQLSKRQKACYDALEAISIDEILTAPQIEYGGDRFRRIMVSVDGLTGSSIQGSFSGGGFTPAPSSAAVESGIYTDLCAAIVALRYDRPDILWMGYMRYGYKVVQSGSSAARVTDVMFDFYLEYGGQEKTMWETMTNNAKTLATLAEKAGDTYQKVKFVHDALAGMNTYGDPADDVSHTAYSALVTEDAYEPVCDGYSKAFKIICGLLGIPCAMPSSATTADFEGHMWNDVKMDDGEWYIVDVTWDDSGDQGLTDYFLIGSQTVVDGEPFYQQKEHKEENPYDAYMAEDGDGVLKPVSLKFPVKSKTAYEYLGQDYPPLTFPDVKRSSWYYAAVENAVSMKLFVGNEDGLFLPDRNITRAEFAIVMSKALGADLSGYTVADFTDVPANAWYTAAVAWANDAGLMKGEGNKKFRPEAQITRQEMCMVISHVLPESGLDAGVVFPDDGKIASWAQKAVYRCKVYGIVKGDEKGNFNPLGMTQRSAAAVVFTKASEYLTAQPEQPAPEETTPEETQPEETAPEQTQPEG